MDVQYKGQNICTRYAVTRPAGRVTKISNIKGRVGSEQEVFNL